MIPDCDGRSDGRSDGRTESIIAKTALCIASYADALSKITYRPTCIGNKIISNHALQNLLVLFLLFSSIVLVMAMSLMLAISVLFCLLQMVTASFNCRPAFLSSAVNLP